MAERPLYYMLGQDPALKGSLAEAWLTNNEDGNLDDAEATIKIYDHDASTVKSYDTTPGSALSNTQSAGDKLIIGPDCSLFRDMLADLHSGGFHVVKRTDMGAIGGTVVADRWAKTHAEHWANIAAADTAIRADITGGGDTPTPKGAFLCFGYEEAILGDTAVDAAFESDLKQFISDLRNDYLASATAPIVLELPPKTVAGYTGAQLTSLANARKVIQKVAADDEFVSFIQTDKLQRSKTGGINYTGEGVMSLGRSMAKEMKLLVNGKGSVSGKGVPVVIMVGETDVVGGVEDSVLANFGDHAAAAALSKVWNWGSNTWESYDPTTNSNTETDGATKFGFDVTLVDQLELNTFLDSGVYLFKLGRNASSLGNAAATGGSWSKADSDIYTTLLNEWAVAKQALLDAEDVVPDVVAIVFSQGEEDVATDALADAYALNLKTFLDLLRVDFATRVGVTTPVILTRMKNTGKYDWERVKKVRDAQQAWVDSDGASAIVDLDTHGKNTDLVHLSGEGLMSAGLEVATQVARLAGPE